MVHLSFVYVVNTNMLSCSSVLIAGMLCAIGKENGSFLRLLFLRGNIQKHITCLFMTDRFMVIALVTPTSSYIQPAGAHRYAAYSVRSCAYRARIYTRF